ncbi:hypothetical protein CLOM_g1628 [Closterium sp. NIES-68]|nr:hypothetical protein CLOM_g1628 [Closterium sp. NIES-68]
MTWNEKSLATQVEQLSAYLTEACGGKLEGDSTSTGHLTQRSNTQHLDSNYLARLILKSPAILSYSPHHISAKLALLQSFTPPGSPPIASSILSKAPTVLNRSRETLLAKLQFVVELVGGGGSGEGSAQPCESFLCVDREPAWRC